MVFEEVKEIIVDTLGCDGNDITMDTLLKEDLEADSLDAVELVMAIEDQYSIEIPDEVASNIKSVKDIVDFVEQNI